MTPTTCAKRSDFGLEAVRPFIAMGAQVTWSSANGHIVRLRGFGGPPG